MNRLGKQLICNALGKVKHTVSPSCTTSIRLYSLVSKNNKDLKWHQYGSILYSNLNASNCHNTSGRLSSLLSIPHRSLRQQALPDEPSQDNNENENIINKTSQVSDEQVAEFFHKYQVHVQGLEDPRIEKPIFNFSQIQLPDKLQAVMNQWKYDEPTPIQSQALPILLSGRDLIGIAQTGSGKTLAYLLPALNKFYSIHQKYLSRNNSYDNQSATDTLNPKVLVLAPTRELACQINEVVKQFRMFRSICLYGGSDRNRQVRSLYESNPLIVVSTPGRLKDLTDAGALSLKEIEYLVVDEADRMLDMGFEPQISELIRRCPKERQTMMFSATWPNEVKSLVHKYLKPNHAFLSIGGTKLVANHNIVQHVVVCDRTERNVKIGEILKKHANEKMIVFCNTKSGCDMISRMIYGKYRIRAAPLHGDLSQRQRENTLDDIRAGRSKVICATNVAARGLDIDDVGVVINYDIDDDIETYVHRIGRTGRKQNKGHAYSFFVDEHKNLLARGLIEILQESNNPVPDELQAIADNPSTGKNRNSANRRFNENRPRFNDHSFNENRPRFNDRFNENRPRFNENRPRFNENRPRFNDSFNDRRNDRFNNRRNDRFEEDFDDRY